MYKPITATRSFQHIVAQIEDLITAGQLHIGDKLPGERELAEQFRVSRVVVREAIRDLQARGVIEVRQGSGTYVQLMPSQALTRSLTLLLHLEKPALIDLFVARRALELAAVSLAAQHATSEQISALEKCISEMSAIARPGLHIEDNFYAYGDKDLQFHTLIAEASHNSILQSLLSAVLPLFMAGRVEVVKRLGSFDKFLDRSPLHELLVHKEHIDIADAIITHDAVAAEQRMKLHLDRAFAVYGNLMPDSEEQTEVAVKTSDNGPAN